MEKRTSGLNVSVVDRFKSVICSPVLPLEHKGNGDGTCARDAGQTRLHGMPLFIKVEYGPV